MHSSLLRRKVGQVMAAYSIALANARFSNAEVYSDPLASGNSPSGANGFPPGFLWGSATAAYQVKGTVHEGGRRVSIWDTFSNTPGKVVNAGGDPNPRGLAFYDRLVDSLLAAGIQSYCTLFHWDLPQVLQDRGGWENRDTAKAFADYAGYTAEN